MGGENRPAPSPTGKTMGDVLDGILSNPSRWLALFGLLAALAGFVLLVMLVFTRLFGVETKEVRIGGAESHIVFESVERRSGNQEFVVIVNPQGWQKTSIDVRPGDRVSFSANGKICIDLHNIWEKADLRAKYEEEWARKKGIKRDDPNETQVPEDYFTDEQRRSLMLTRPWVDPGGFDLAAFQPSFRSRRNRYLLPDVNAASLIGAIKGGSNGTPARSDAFFIGRSKDDYPVSQSGWVWFTVNDVQYKDETNANIFYNDNIGSFWVRVVVKRG
jgi:hypothetical protein